MNTKNFSLVLALIFTSSFASAELAGAKANGTSAPAAPTDSFAAACPVRPKVDPKLEKPCPKSLGEIPLNMDAAVEYEVTQYHPETESFSITGVLMPDEGDLPVTLEALAKSDGVLAGAKDNKEKMATLKKSLTSPCDLLKRKIKLKNIQTLSDNDLKARKNCVRK